MLCTHPAYAPGSPRVGHMLCTPGLGCCLFIVYFSDTGRVSDQLTEWVTHNMSLWRLEMSFPVIVGEDCCVYMPQHR